MLQTFRNHKRWLMFIATVFIIPSFIVTGVYSYKMSGANDNAIAKVGDEYIQPEAFDMQKRERLARLQAEMGENFRPTVLDNPEAAKSILRQMMDDAALRITVDKEHLLVPEAQAVAFIKSADALKENGKFSPELYENFLRSQGKSDQQFVAQMRVDLAKENLMSGITATHPVPKALAQDLHDMLTEEREVRTLVLNVGDFYDDTKVTDDEIAAYYKAHQADFLAPEHLTVEYLVLSPESFKAKAPDESDLKTYYEQNKGRWTVPEERRASHILVDFGKDKAAALKQAEALLAKAKADPSKFAELAREHSSDTGSAGDGGDLSFFGRGVMTKPFEDAVFAAKKGDIVGPIESEFGYHIIYVTDVHEKHVRSYAEVKPEIEKEYAEQMALREFSERADDFTNTVYEQSDSLAPAAEKFGLKVQKAENVTRDGVSDPALKKLLNDHVVELLFGDEALNEHRNTTAVEVASNTLVAARVAKHFPTKQLTLDDVRQAIEVKLKTEKASELARAEGEKMVAELNKTKDLKGFSKPVWVSRQNTQGEPNVLVDHQIALDDKKLPAFIGTALPGGAYFVSYVSAKREKPSDAAQMTALSREIGSIYGEAERRAYLDALEKLYKAEILRPKFLEGDKKGNDAQ